MEGNTLLKRTRDTELSSNQGDTELMKNNMEENLNETILKANPNKYVMFPIQQKESYEYQKIQMINFWTADEIDLKIDLTDFKSLSDSEKYFIKQILAFFVHNSKTNLGNITIDFLAEVQIPEIRAFYGWQIAKENIHAEVQSLLVHNFFKDDQEINELFKTIEASPVTKRKEKWIYTYIENSKCFAERILAFVITKGIFFSGSQCSIFWLKQKGLFPGLVFSNDRITRDENLHTDFSCSVQTMLENKIPEDKVYEMVNEAVFIEKLFVTEIYPVEVIGINSKLIKEYIEYIADNLLISLGYLTQFNTKNPFEWTERSLRKNLCEDLRTNNNDQSEKEITFDAEF